MEVIHTVTIVKRNRDRPSPVSSEDKSFRFSACEEDSKATCLCGWSSDWQPTEQLAREKYGKHKFMSVKSPFL